MTSWNPARAAAAGSCTYLTGCTRPVQDEYSFFSFHYKIFNHHPLLLSSSGHRRCFLDRLSSRAAFRRPGLRTQGVSPPDPAPHRQLQGAALTVRMRKVSESCLPSSAAITPCCDLWRQHTLSSAGDKRLFLTHGELKELAKALLAIFLTQTQYPNT